MHRPDVDAMLAELTATQLAEWEAFAALEPFGPLRDDLRAGKTVAAVYNCAFGRSKDSVAVKPQDVFESLAPDPLAPQSPAEMRAAVVRKKGRKG